VLGAQRLLGDGKAALLERLSLAGTALLGIEPGQIVEPGTKRRMIGPQRLFGTGQSTFEKWLCVSVATLRLIKLSQVVELDPYIGVAGSLAFSMMASARLCSGSASSYRPWSW
jgi:hypothetical protein